MKMSLILVASAIAFNATAPTPLSKKCSATEEAVDIKSKEFEIQLENASARLFEAQCHPLHGTPKSCDTVFNWTRLGSTLHQFQDVVQSVDKSGQVCFVNMQFNMKTHRSSGIAYNYNLGRAGVFPVSAACTAQDRSTLLLRAYEMLLLQTTKLIPDAQISDVTAEWSDKSCAGPTQCIGKKDFICYSSHGFCEADIDVLCPIGTVCSEAFHNKFPTKDPCVQLSQTYGCDKTTKTCVEKKGYLTLDECNNSCL